MPAERNVTQLKRYGFTDQEIAKKAPRRKRATRTAAGVLTEYEEQKALMAAARGPWGKALGIDRKLVHVPNSGHGKNLGQASMLKATGLRTGYPDLILDKARGGYHGLRIEMKTLKGGTVSPEQREWIDYLRAEGYCAEVCRGRDEAMAVISSYMLGNLVRGEA